MRRILKQRWLSMEHPFSTLRKPPRHFNAHSQIARRIFIWMAWWLLVSLPTAASANLPLGGKTASMGGAGAAAGKDAAMPFINPAGYSQVPHHNFMQLSFY